MSRPTNFGVHQLHRVIRELDPWLRRRVRLYHWKQWKNSRARRRNLIRLGIHPREVYKSTRSHRGYWFMAGTEIVQRALDNRWLEERGVPSLVQQWVQMHYGHRNTPTPGRLKPPGDPIGLCGFHLLVSLWIVAGGDC